MLERFSRLPGSLLKSAAIGLAVILVAARFYPLYREPRGDFDLHYGLAQRLVAGQFLYGPGFDRVYPPFWAFAHAPFTFFDMHRIEMLLFPFGLAGMVALVVVLKRLADRPWPVAADPLFWSTALAILLAGPFLHRDLVELGVNTFLVLLTWLGIYLWTRGHDALAGVPIGMAAALKCTPVAFIVYFFWKRQWKIGLCATAATIFFTCLPATVMGVHEFKHTEGYWLKNVVWTGVSDPDPSHTVLGLDRVGNLSLRTALAVPHAPALRPSGPPGNSGGFPHPGPAARTALF